MARNNIVKKLILGSAQFGEKYGSITLVRLYRKGVD